MLDKAQVQDPCKLPAEPLQDLRREEACEKKIGHCNRKSLYYNNPEVGYREMAQKWVVRSSPKVGRKKVAQKLDITAKLSKYFTSPILGRESSIIL